MFHKGSDSTRKCGVSSASSSLRLSPVDHLGFCLGSKKVVEMANESERVREKRVGLMLSTGARQTGLAWMRLTWTVIVDDTSRCHRGINPKQVNLQVYFHCSRVVALLIRPRPFTCNQSTPCKMYDMAVQYHLQHAKHYPPVQRDDPKKHR